MNPTRKENSEQARLREEDARLAEQIAREVVDDPASNLNDLALFYVRQGKYEQAEPLYRRALAIREQRLGAQHPDTATSLDDLARLYRRQGKYEQAELLYQRALAIREQ